VALIFLIINGYIQKYLNSKLNLTNQSNSNTLEIQTIKVEGMTCNHCKNNVETSLEKLSFINSAKVNMSDKSVTIEGDNIEVDKAKETIGELGYKPY